MNGEKAFAFLLLALSVCVSWLVVWPFFTYVALAVLLAYALYPLQRRLAPRIGPRKSAVALMVAATVLFVLPFALLLRTVLRQALSVAERVQSGDIDLAVFQRFLETDLGADLLSAIRSGAGTALQETTGFLGSVSNVALGFTILGFLLYYLLVGGDSVVR
jgi:predicted PurR-regulated permease PerM